MLENLNSNENDPEQLRRNIQETKDGLLEKIETFEREAKKEVEEVKGSMKQSFEDAKKAVDFRLPIKKHPLSSMAIGIIAGAVIENSLHRLRSRNEILNRAALNKIEPSQRETIQSDPGLLNTFAPEIKQLKKIALSTLLSPIGEVLERVVPARISAQANCLLDKFIGKI